MGSNRRYAHHYDALIDDRVLERQIAEAGPLQSLSPEELRLDVVPVTISPRPEKVRAWVRFGSTPVRVRAVAARWTDHAIGIVFTVRGTEYRCWVWGPAVTREPGAPTKPVDTASVQM